MKRLGTSWLAFATSILLLSALGGWVYRATKPYPRWYREYVEEKTAYSTSWEISRHDYHAIRTVVGKETQGHEIISRFYPVDAIAVEVDTTERWRGPLAARGRSFKLTKQSGKWEIVGIGFWMS
jgi:hypothetical protein